MEYVEKKSFKHTPNDEDDFLNSLLEETLPNEIKFRPSGEMHNNISREEFIAMQMRNAQQNIRPKMDPVQNDTKKQKKLQELQQLEQEDFEMLHEYILTGKITQTAIIMNTTWHMHVLSYDESQEAVQRSESYNEDSRQLAQVLFVLSFAVDQIEDYKFKSFNETRQYLEKLPLYIIYKAIDEYNFMFKRQENIMMNPQQIKSLVQNDYLRIKYQVMKNSGLVPAHPLVQKMNDAQWLWYYYNMDEDLEQKAEVRQSELDYMGVFINPKMAQEMIKQNEGARKRRQAEKDKMYKKLKQKVRKSNQQFLQERQKRKKTVKRVIKEEKPKTWLEEIKESEQKIVIENVKENKTIQNEKQMEQLFIQQSTNIDNFFKSSNQEETEDKTDIAKENIKSNTNKDLDKKDVPENVTNNIETSVDDDFINELLTGEKKSTLKQEIKSIQDNIQNDTQENIENKDKNNFENNANNNIEDNSENEELDDNELLDDMIELGENESVLDEIYGHSTYTADNTVTNTEFEKELRAALGIDNKATSIEDQFTVLSDDNGAGDAYETPEDFLERVKAFMPVAGTEYGYKKPVKQKVRQQVGYKPTYIAEPNLPINQQDFRAQLKEKGQQNKDIIQNDQSKINFAKKDIQRKIQMPQWKTDSDNEFMRKTGIQSLNSLNQLSKNINKNEEINKLTDDMDFFDVDDE